MRLGSTFMKKVISKLIKKSLKKKFGYDVDIQLNELDVTIIDGTAKLHVNVDAELNKEELTKIVKNMGLD